MKKLMIAAFTVAVGMVANAAVIDWSLEAKSPTEGTYATGYIAYVFDSATWSAMLVDGITSTDFAGYADKSALYANGSTGKSTKTYLFDTSDGETLGGLRMVDGFSGTTADLVAVIANSDGYAAFDFTATVRDAQAPVTSASELVYTQAQIDGAWQSVGDVPEPTSGLLLLLGMVGLALRRRHA